MAFRREDMGKKRADLVLFGTAAVRRRVEGEIRLRVCLSCGAIPGETDRLREPCAWLSPVAGRHQAISGFIQDGRLEFATLNWPFRASELAPPVIHKRIS